MVPSCFKLGSYFDICCHLSYPLVFLYSECDGCLIIALSIVQLFNWLFYSTFSIYTIFNDFLVHNLEYFTFNFLVHSIDTGKKVRRHKPIANFASYWRGVYYTTIKIFNKLLASIAELVKDKKYFILTLKRFLIVKSFYSVNEYLNYQHQNIDDCSIRKELQTMYFI
jgi:hypothetical protein